jgi:hypothetical protein
MVNFFMQRRRRNRGEFCVSHMRITSTVNTRFFAMQRFLALSALALVIAGCASTPTERITKYQSTFDSWPAEVQAKVRAGQIAVGFTEQQVRVALGEPDRVFSRVTEKGPTTVWAYRHRGPRVSLGLGLAGGSGHTGYGGGVAMTDRGYDDSLHAVFADGKVVSIETLRR